MLVLSRKTEESIVVGGSVGFESVLKVTVLEIRGGKVKLGFEADADFPVHRSELWDRMSLYDPTGDPAPAKFCRLIPLIAPEPSR